MIDRVIVEDSKFFKIQRNYARYTSYPLFSRVFIILLYYNKDPDYRDILILSAIIYIQRPVLIFNFITIQSDYT